MVRITKRVVNTYYARIFFGKPGEKVILSVDVRPSDAINVATRCKQRISSASDMWSLGVLMYILLSGYPPFNAKSNHLKQRLVLAAEFSFDEYSWKSISPSAKQLISSLLAVDPCKRPTAQEAIREKQGLKK